MCWVVYCCGTGGMSTGDDRQKNPKLSSLSSCLILVDMAVEPASLMYVTTNPLGFVWIPFRVEDRTSQYGSFELRASFSMKNNNFMNYYASSEQWRRKIGLFKDCRHSIIYQDILTVIVDATNVHVQCPCPARSSVLVQPLLLGRKTQQRLS